MPVIAAAIAAPAASASGGTTTPPAYSATLTILGANTANTTFVSSTGTGVGTDLKGTGPTAFEINNTGRAIGAVSGTISIVPSAPLPTGGVLAGAGIQSIVPATLASPAYSGTHDFNATFSSGSLASGAKLNVPLHFQYQRVNQMPKKVTYYYTMTITLTLPDGKSVTLPGVALSVAF